ncbi:efflux transporter outer membrane subunit [Noviherbaspirillum sp. DKR-6]|uniref:Efflux transporter outer membrane subunit n=2 Tax=Noviherbaspirillum pedocola TaxID=2801341 RepID=A0A934W6U5_9BURK|nr:efflux transporter outer membrane subunit [Noviherbaspirillum pedocola]
MALLAALLLSGCGTLSRAPADAAAPLPVAWQAPLPRADAEPLPHDGSPAGLQGWWQAQGDALLPELIAAAQRESPDLASALSLIGNARSTRVAAGAALAPTLDVNAQAARNSAQPPLPIGTTVQGAAQTAWEIDLFGANRAARDAAQARLEGAQAGWHDARVAVAAEVATRYYSVRACRQLLVIARADAASRRETARLTRLAGQAGFQSPANQALADASAADGENRVVQQAASCDVEIKTLVALTGIAEPELRRRLDESASVLPQSSAAAVPAVPADMVGRRPDLVRAAREVAAASADIGNAEAQRYPRLSLSGSIGMAYFAYGDNTGKLDTWSIGPLALTLPIYDGGRRSANIDAARLRYASAAAAYRAAVRRAIGEVEQALVRLDSTARRSDAAQIAVAGYRDFFRAAEERYRSGLGSLIDLEEARRSRLAAETALISLRQERTNAWIGLYRAVGGDWDGKPDIAAVPDTGRKTP